ncbi:MAG: undecaprenyl-diphosphate phosphatase [Clostridia bacterium]|jgi:undecaprenyl-diphosphatase|nr:undecaprenyl-diphosphate phosphatase [Clostridia bacterium]
MELVNYIVMGIIQGVAEFLPISSSGHLVISKEILGIEAPAGVLEVVLHLGTLISILLVYREEIWGLIVEFFKMIGDTFRLKPDLNKNENRKFITLVLLASIPTGIIGILFKDCFEEMFGSLLYVGIALLITGTILLLTKKYENTTRDFKEVGFLNGLVVGIVQGFAIVPGISRSGSTIFAGLLTGMKKENAVKYSFFISIPAIMGAALLKYLDLTSEELAGIMNINYLAAFIAAIVIGYISIKFLINMLNKGKMYLFAYYCYAVGILSLVYYFVK